MSTADRRHRRQQRTSPRGQRDGTLLQPPCTAFSAQPPGGRGLRPGGTSGGAVGSVMSLINGLGTSLTPARAPLAADENSYLAEVGDYGPLGDGNALPWSASMTYNPNALYYAVITQLEGYGDISDSVTEVVTTYCSNGIHKTSGGELSVGPVLSWLLRGCAAARWLCHAKHQRLPLAVDRCGRHHPATPRRRVTATTHSERATRSACSGACTGRILGAWPGLYGQSSA
jgi:hypothetical protein